MRASELGRAHSVATRWDKAHISEHGANAFSERLETTGTRQNSSVTKYCSQLSQSWQNKFHKVISDSHGIVTTNILKLQLHSAKMVVFFSFSITQINLNLLPEQRWEQARILFSPSGNTHTLHLDLLFIFILTHLLYPPFPCMWAMLQDMTDFRICFPRGLFSCTENDNRSGYNPKLTRLTQFTLLFRCPNLRTLCFPNVSHQLWNTTLQRILALFLWSWQTPWPTVTEGRKGFTWPLLTGEVHLWVRTGTHAGSWSRDHGGSEFGSWLSLYHAHLHFIAQATFSGNETIHSVLGAPISLNSLLF